MTLLISSGLPPISYTLTAIPEDETPDSKDVTPSSEISGCYPLSPSKNYPHEINHETEFDSELVDVNDLQDVTLDSQLNISNSAQILNVSVSNVKEVDIVQKKKASKVELVFSRISKYFRSCFSCFSRPSVTFIVTDPNGAMTISSKSKTDAIAGFFKKYCIKR